MKNAQKFSLSIKDGIKGLITSVLTVIVTMFLSLLNTGVFPMTFEAWKPILMASVGAGLAYILKNWLTTSDDKFLGTETKQP